MTGYVIGPDDGIVYRASDLNEHAARIHGLRPVVVIDPEDAEQASRLLRLYGEQYTSWTPDASGPNVDRLQAALREFAAPTPPKPDEPTAPGSIIEAACVHSRKRRRWIRGFDDNWWPEERLTYGAAHSEQESPDDWDSLIDPATTPTTERITTP